MSCIREFQYTFLNNDEDLTIKYPVEIPLPELMNIEELAYLVSNNNDIPIYLFEDLKTKLGDFVYDEKMKYFDEIGDALIDLEVDKDELVKFWSNWYKTTVKKYSDQVAPSDEIMFSKVFTSLVDSSHVQQLIDVQLEFSDQVSKVVKARDEYLNVLQLRQQKEMEMALKNLGVLYQEEDINDMAKRHAETQQMSESKYANELKALGEAQRQDFKQLCFGLHKQLNSKLPEDDIDQSKLSSEDDDQSKNKNQSLEVGLTESQTKSNFEYINDSASNIKVQSIVKNKSLDNLEENSSSSNQSASHSKTSDQSTSHSKPSDQSASNAKTSDHSNSHSKTFNQSQTSFLVNEYVSDDCSLPREESFTVNIGSQLKTTQNIKLMSCDILDFCGLPAHFKQEDDRALKLQIMLTLYSFSLKGVVLMVDKNFNSFRGIKKRFSRICDRSTDLHFPSLNDQLDQIQKKRIASLTNKQTEISITTNEFPKLIESNKTEKHLQDMSPQIGDIYVTRHSNLSQVHAVFHVITEDTLRDINSRHPIINSLKNIIWACFTNDVQDIAIPLLLAHEYTDDMNLNWCVQRAELVLKCVKGFVVENAMRSADKESIILQFIVPKDLPDEIFEALREMIPTIFKMTNPVSIN